MRQSLIPISLLAYLSCATPPLKVQVPIVEVPPYSSNIVDKGTRIVDLPPKEPSAKTAADFIVKTLEEKITEHAGATYARGYIKFNTPLLYDLQYTFNPANVCELGSSKPLSKGSLQVSVQDWKYIVNGNNTQTSIYFYDVSPFYIAKDFSFHQMASNGLSGVFDIYAAFPEAQKFYEEMLLYIAEELKQDSQNIAQYGDIISVQHKERNIDQREEKLFQRFKGFLDALPAQQPIPLHKYISLSPCNP